MSTYNVPWKNSKLKEVFSYRLWDSLSIIKQAKKKKHLLNQLKEEKNIILVHIPKTAGVSIITAYRDSFAEARHTTALHYKCLLANDFCKFKTFSIVRNPWARLLSAYNFLMQGGLTVDDRNMGAVLNRECNTFDEFIKNWLPRHSVYSFTHFIPQNEFVCGFGDKIIVDEIVKLESLDSDWVQVTQRLGLPYRRLAKENSTKLEKNYSDFYDDESKEIVAELYKKDIVLFDYDF
ncbi:sulfotransferase family protein [Thalassotalea litorea]|uniref:Sulfotransferase family protein n=1 Tax=Thalassotalea litorea TaxID=2020715 RepID=A0A5R9IKF2_9GAMM|nr:sulfotransferase family 2 domain-containing protein [Thalassotalea litorea]TLU65059.1 sulfotransferase family protein [Thalassotalea litorea]